MTPEQKSQAYAQKKHVDLLDRVCPAWTADEVVRHVNDAFLSGYAAKEEEMNAAILSEKQVDSMHKGYYVSGSSDMVKYLQEMGYSIIKT